MSSAQMQRGVTIEDVGHTMYTSYNFATQPTAVKRRRDSSATDVTSHYHGSSSPPEASPAKRMRVSPTSSGETLSHSPTKAADVNEHVLVSQANPTPWNGQSVMVKQEVSAKPGSPSDRLQEPCKAASSSATPMGGDGPVYTTSPYSTPHTTPNASANASSVKSDKPPAVTASGASPANAGEGGAAGMGRLLDLANVVAAVVEQDQEMSRRLQTYPPAASIAAVANAAATSRSNATVPTAPIGKRHRSISFGFDYTHIPEQMPGSKMRRHSESSRGRGRKVSESDAVGKSRRDMTETARNLHAVTEQKRRTDIRLAFDALKESLPLPLNACSSKVEILREASHFIHCLTSRDGDLGREKARLQMAVRELRQRHFDLVAKLPARLQDGMERGNGEEGSALSTAEAESGGDGQKDRDNKNGALVGST